MFLLNNSFLTLRVFFTSIWCLNYFWRQTLPSNIIVWEILFKFLMNWNFKKKPSNLVNFRKMDLSQKWKSRKSTNLFCEGFTKLLNFFQQCVLHKRFISGPDHYTHNLKMSIAFFCYWLSVFHFKFPKSFAAVLRTYSLKKLSIISILQTYLGMFFHHNASNIHLCTCIYRIQLC